MILVSTGSLRVSDSFSGVRPSALIKRHPIVKITAWEPYETGNGLPPNAEAFFRS